jgi:hypothetical protein
MTRSTSPASSGTPTQRPRLRVYAHLFEKARHADELRDGLGERFGHLLARSG